MKAAKKIPIREESKPHPVDIHVGRRIREIRKSRKMTQNDLAKQTGVTFQQIQKYENADNRVTTSRLWMITEILDVEVGKLFGDG